MRTRFPIILGNFPLAGYKPTVLFKPKEKQWSYKHKKSSGFKSGWDYFRLSEQWTYFTYLLCLDNFSQGRESTTVSMTYIPASLPYQEGYALEFASSCLSGGTISAVSIDDRQLFIFSPNLVPALQYVKKYAKVVTD